MAPAAMAAFTSVSSTFRKWQIPCTACLGWPNSNLIAENRSSVSSGAGDTSAPALPQRLRRGGSETLAVPSREAAAARICFTSPCRSSSARSDTVETAVRFPRARK
eukprot:scaffold13716_cov122-Isochrysis_galbana.AAC.3